MVLKIDVCIALHACDAAADQSLVRRCDGQVVQRLRAVIMIYTFAKRACVVIVVVIVYLISSMTSIARHGILYERTIDNVTDAW